MKASFVVLLVSFHPAKMILKEEDSSMIIKNTGTQFANFIVLFMEEI